MVKKLVLNAIKFSVLIIIFSGVNGPQSCYGMFVEGVEWAIVKPIVAKYHPCTQWHGLGRHEHCSLCAAEEAESQAKVKPLKTEEKKSSETSS